MPPTSVMQESLLCGRGVLSCAESHERDSNAATHSSAHSHLAQTVDQSGLSDFVKAVHLGNPQVAEGLGLARWQGAAQVDLHGLGEAEARAAVLCALRALQQRAREGKPPPAALTIITGAARGFEARVCLGRKAHRWFAAIASSPEGCNTKASSLWAK